MREHRRLGTGPWPLRSIQILSTSLIALCVALVLLAGQFTIDRILSARLQQNFDRTLLAKAQVLVTLTRFDGTQVELDFADEFMPEYAAETDQEYFELFLDSGILLERSHSFDDYPPSVYQPATAPVRFDDIRLADGRAGRRVVVDFIPQIEDKTLRPSFPDATREHAVLRVARERESLDKSLLDLHLVLLGIGLIAVTATTFAVVLAMRVGLRPLKTMQREIAVVGAASIDRRLSTNDQPRELEPIARQFNKVLDELELAFKRERQFSANVAHELRTPVAELRAFAEVALKWPEERDVEGFFDHVLQASRNLDTLIGNLLHLARADNGEVSARNQATDVAVLTSEVWRSLEQQAIQRRITLDNRFTDLPPLYTDPNWLRLIVENLLSNAVEYSPPGSRIACDWHQAGTRYALRFANPGGDLTAKDLPFLLDRFWRGDAARSGGQHAGIGLSLVNSYSAVLGTTVAVALEAGEYCVTIGTFERS